MDATTMPYFLSASYPPNEVLAHASRLPLHGRDCQHQWLWPLTERLFPGGSVAGVCVEATRWRRYEPITG